MVPFPGSLWISIVPPCNSASRFVNGSPSPTPSCSLVRLLPICPNGDAWTWLAPPTKSTPPGTVDLIGASRNWARPVLRSWRFGIEVKKPS